MLARKDTFFLHYHFELESFPHNRKDNRKHKFDEFEVRNSTRAR